MKEDKMSVTLQRTRPWLWLTVPITLLVALTSAAGLSVPGLYRGPLSWALQGRAQDLIDLIVLAVLVISSVFVGRGSRRARLVWLGTLSYLAYTFVIYCLSVYFNSLFLVYVAVLGLSFWALIGGMATTDWVEIREHFAANTPVKVVSLLMLAQVVLFYMAWLKEDIPALLAGTIPTSVIENGTPTNSIHVLDMAMLLPAIALSAIWLWRKQTLGFGMAGIMLTNMIFQMVNIIGVMLFYLSAGIVNDPSSISMFVIIGVVNLALLSWHLARMNASAPTTWRAAHA
jgi:hypothetical protein